MSKTRWEIGYVSTQDGYPILKDGKIQVDLVAIEVGSTRAIQHGGQYAYSLKGMAGVKDIIRAMVNRN